MRALSLQERLSRRNRRNFRRQQHDGVPHVRELTSAARDMGSSMDEVSDTYHSTLSNMEATASVADQYISKLEAIEAATNGNTAGNAEYHDTLARLSALVPQSCG